MEMRNDEWRSTGWHYERGTRKWWSGVWRVPWCGRRQVAVAWENGHWKLGQRIIDINFDRPDSELDSIALAFMDRVFFLPPMAVVTSVLVLAMSKDAEEIGGTMII
ncbi:hypothetical protein C8J57DRAFT_1257937 [Mycena rebaudengoi]|nr:hypothetical protein C8J57DRAFT_1257937 [Mycena rebaudengoi]